MSDSLRQLALAARITAIAAVMGTATGCGALPPASPPAPAGRAIELIGSPHPPSDVGAASPQPRDRDATRTPPATGLPGPHRGGTSPRTRPWRRILSVARRFAAAEQAIEHGRAGPRALGTIEHQSTPELARRFLAQRAATVPTAPELERIESIQALSRRADHALVLVRLSLGARHDPGAIELTLTRRRRRWRVAQLDVLR